MDNKTMIPGAIIIAGLLIAGAVFYNGSGNTGEQPAGPGEVQARNITLRDVSPNEHLFGNPGADIFVVEYSDIDCPFCSRFHVTMHDVVDNYDGRVAWAYRHLPLAQIHPLAATKAEATECVAELGGNDAFWTFLDTLFEQENEGLGDLAGIAAAAGVDQAAFEACLDSDRHVATVNADSQDARRAGGTGTPYSVIVTKETLSQETENAIKEMILRTRDPRTGRDSIFLGEDKKTVGISGAQPYENVTQVIDSLLADLG